MSRVKRGVISMKRRRNVLAQVKGYRFGRSTKEAQAREAIVHAGTHAFRDRKKKKRVARGMWQTTIGVVAKENGTSYSKLIGNLKKKDILINRKMLAEIAAKHPDAFKSVLEAAK